MSRFNCKVKGMMLEYLYIDFSGEPHLVIRLSGFNNGEKIIRNQLCLIQKK